MARCSTDEQSILAKLRSEAGLTIRQLATKAELSATAVWRAEHGIAPDDVLVAFWLGYQARLRLGDAGEVRADEEPRCARPISQVKRPPATNP